MSNMQVSQPLRLDQIEGSFDGDGRQIAASKTENKTLKQSIAALGQLVPIIVVAATNSEGKPIHKIVAGHRRYEAIKEIGLQHIQAVIIPADTKDVALHAARLAENLHRKQVDPYEEAAAFKAMSIDGTSVSEIAAFNGVTPHYVKQRMALAELDPAFVAHARKHNIQINVMLAVAGLPQILQRQLKKSVGQDPWFFNNADNIKRWASSRRRSLATALFDTSQLDQKTIEADLFSNDKYTTDVDTFDSLQQRAAIELAAKIYADEGWGWGKVNLRHNISTRDDAYAMVPPDKELPAYHVFCGAEVLNNEDPDQAWEDDGEEETDEDGQPIEQPNNKKLSTLEKQIRMLRGSPLKTWQKTGRQVKELMDEDERRKFGFVIELSSQGATICRCYKAEWPRQVTSQAATTESNAAGTTGSPVKDDGPKPPTFGFNEQANVDRYAIIATLLLNHNAICVYPMILAQMISNRRDSNLLSRLATHPLAGPHILKFFAALTDKPLAKLEEIASKNHFDTIEVFGYRGENTETLRDRFAAQMNDSELCQAIAFMALLFTDPTWMEMQQRSGKPNAILKAIASTVQGAPHDIGATFTPVELVNRMRRDQLLEVFEDLGNTKQNAPKKVGDLKTVVVEKLTEAKSASRHLQQTKPDKALAL